MHRVRGAEPSLALVFDAVDMGLTPGEVRLVDDRLIADRPIMTTHNLPVGLLIASLRETIPDVRLLGVQPAVVAFGYPMSSDVERAVQNVHGRLSSGTAPSAWPSLVAAEGSGDASAATAPSDGLLFSCEGVGR
jgi:hydrogenase 3 maturation protease